jgi:copper chaperone
MTTTLEISGMTCHACTTHVGRALRDVDGVTRVDVRLREGVAVVETAAETPPIAEMIAAVEDAGYQAVLPMKAA